MKNWINKITKKVGVRSDAADTTDTMTTTYGSSSAIKQSLFKDMQSTVLSSRASQVLSATLAMQLLFAGGLYWSSRDNAEFATHSSLVALDVELLEEVVIDDGEDTITLKREDESWHIAGDTDPLKLPVDSAKIDEALASLADLKTGLPVAMNRSSQGQLEVASDNYQRLVSLKTSEESAATDLYLGTSPGFRKAHVRKAGEDNIYAAKVNVFDLPTEVDRWMDKQLLSFTDISKIEGDDFIVEKTDDQWQIVEPVALSESHVVDETEIADMVASLETFSVTGTTEALDGDELSKQDHPAPLVIEDEADAQESDPIAALESIASIELPEDIEEDTTSTLAFTVTTKGGSTSELVLSRTGDDVTVMHSDWKNGFSASVSTFDKFEQISADSLLTDPPVEAPQAESDNQHE